MVKISWNLRFHRNNEANFLIWFWNLVQYEISKNPILFLTWDIGSVDTIWVHNRIKWALHIHHQWISLACCLVLFASNLYIWFITLFSWLRRVTKNSNANWFHRLQRKENNCWTGNEISLNCSPLRWCVCKMWRVLVMWRISLVARRGISCCNMRIYSNVEEWWNIEFRNTV